MSDLETLIATVVGGGGALTVIACGLLYVTKEAIGKAVAQAGSREMERLRATLAGELEEKKASFARELERERQAASRDLEAFKSTLSLDAEMRRQVATARVRALGAIVERGALLVSLLSDVGTSKEIGKKLVPAVDDYSNVVRGNAHLFRQGTDERLTNHAKTMFAIALAASRGQVGGAIDVEAVESLRKECQLLASYARELLGVEDSVVE